jgi:hypothetical protein
LHCITPKIPDPAKNPYIGTGTQTCVKWAGVKADISSIWTVHLSSIRALNVMLNLDDDCVHTVGGRLKLVTVDEDDRPALPPHASPITVYDYKVCLMMT